MDVVVSSYSSRQQAAGCVDCGNHGIGRTADEPRQGVDELFQRQVLSVLADISAPRRSKSFPVTASPNPSRARTIMLRIVRPRRKAAMAQQ